MMNEINRLREQARKARRLAGAITDTMSKDALTHYARECDDHADKLELRAKVEPRSITPERGE